MADKTLFAGLERLAPGESLSTDGYVFQDVDRATIDRLLRTGAITHRHDAHAALANPTLAPTVTVYDTGGSIPAGTPMAVVYTLMDADGGETLPCDPVSVTSASGYADPFDAPVAAVDYTAGTLLAGDYSYAATVTDTAGGETAISPAVDITVEPGNALAQVQISGLQTIVDDSNGGGIGGWRLWRQQGGGPWYLISTGDWSVDTFTDSGLAGNCTVAPPDTSTTQGASTLVVQVPGGQPAGTVSYNIYVSLDGTFTSPALLGNYPIGSAGTSYNYPDLTVAVSGSPPTVSRAFGGANQINPDTDIVNWYWKAPVLNVASLPTTGNNPGDVRVTRDTGSMYIWTGSAWTPWDPTGAPPTTLLARTQSADYTLAASDQNTVVEFTSGAAQNCTVPPNSSVAFPIGTIIEIFQVGLGQVAMLAGAGVTLDSYGGLTHTAGQFATISLRKRGTDEWVLAGNLG